VARKGEDRKLYNFLVGKPEGKRPLGRPTGAQMASLNNLRINLIYCLLCLQVSAIYKDPSLDSNLRLVIVRMIFFEDEKDGQVNTIHTECFLVCGFRGLPWGRR
jgi:hypothetical protein